MFKYIFGSLLDLFDDYCIRNVDGNSHVTRQQHKLHNYINKQYKCLTKIIAVLRCPGSQTNPLSAGINFRRHNLTFVDVRFPSIPALKG